MRVNRDFDTSNPIGGGGATIEVRPFQKKSARFGRAERGRMVAVRSLAHENATCYRYQSLQMGRVIDSLPLLPRAVRLTVTIRYPNTTGFFLRLGTT